MKTSRLLLIATAMLLSTVDVCGQQTNVGNITGSVADSSGAIVPSADVVAVNQATGMVYPTVTTSAGLYNLNLLPIGGYNIVVSKGGFQKQSKLGITVIAGQTFTVDFVLKVGSTTQTVTVTVAPPVVDSSDTAQGTTRTQQEIQDLPIDLGGASARTAVSTMQTFAGVNFNNQIGGGDILGSHLSRPDQRHPVQFRIRDRRRGSEHGRS
jgi:hypothetical protein